MNKTMKKITAALLALCCVPVTGITAGAENLDNWGVTGSWEAFQDMVQLNDRGVCSDQYEWKNTEVYVQEEGNHQHRFVRVSPCTDEIYFTLRDETAITEAAGLLDAYFPGLLDGLDTVSYQNLGQYYYCGEHASLVPSGTGDGHTFRLKVEKPDAETESAVLLALARNHMITEFYGFGEIANYQTGYADEPLQEIQPTNLVVEYGENGRKCYEVWIDFEEVQAYLDANHPGYTVESIDTGYTHSIIDEEGNETQVPTYQYRITGLEALDYYEKMDLTFELAAQFKFDPGIGWLEAPGDTATGHNALERPGDVTLDCTLDIIDVIALNRNLLTGETLCNTAKKNADIDGSGTPDERDTLAILQELVGITKDFEAQ